jgi:predicted subunit of tRNA(5-methylaminomethyl-2-thiouridylate) methyltransferase
MKLNLFNHPAQARFQEPENHPHISSRHSSFEAQKQAAQARLRASTPRTPVDYIHRRYDEALARLAYEAPSPERDEQMASLERKRTEALRRLGQ